LSKLPAKRLLMADLLWSDGEGYDIHVLRTGPASKSLVDAFSNLDPSGPSLVFTPHFKGQPANYGVTVAIDTGIVTATAHPSPAQPKLRNFLMTASQALASGALETVIRIHVHDSVEKIWATPLTLGAHMGTSEARFTILALFDDGVIGDITDWPELAYTSSDTSIAVANTGDPDPVSPRPFSVGGAITVNSAGNSSTLTVELKLTSPATNLSTSGTVRGEPFWPQLGEQAKVVFLKGPKAPVRDAESTSSQHVSTVLAGAVNILFIAEGFQTTQKREFKQLVLGVINDLSKNDSHLPFKLLKKSINYWAIFMPSHDEVISHLGDHVIAARASSAVLPRPPSPAFTWSVENMIHEAGLPAPADAAVATSSAWAANRQALYDIPSNPEIGVSLDGWNRLRSRTLLNERDTAFGLAHHDRPRASGQENSRWRLMLDNRRVSEESLRLFIGALRFGIDPTTTNPVEIGRTWLWETPADPNPGTDSGLICFLSRDDTMAGAWAPAGQSRPYFAANDGAAYDTLVKAAANGTDVAPMAPGRPISTLIAAARAARGCARAFGLGDEYGSERDNPPARAVAGFNLQPEIAPLLTSPPGSVPRVIDAAQIKWLWPRINKVSVVATEFDPNGALLSPLKCDANGDPNPAGDHLRVRLQTFGDFVVDDIVRVRGSLNLGPPLAWIAPSLDEFAAFTLQVKLMLADDELVLGYQSPIVQSPGYLAPNGVELNLGNFSSRMRFVLIAPRMDAGTEELLVAEPIRAHIDATDGPLNAPTGSQGAACNPPPAGFEWWMKPFNLPQNLKVKPDPLSQIVGLYDGGGRANCGVFRPAGRCRMRDEYASTMPFCHVCSYVMVDIINPLIHPKLDRLYPEVRL
jgi:hypothetical protein